MTAALSFDICKYSRPILFIKEFRHNITFFFQNFLFTVVSRKEHKKLDRSIGERDTQLFIFKRRRGESFRTHKKYFHAINISALIFGPCSELTFYY